MIRSYRTRLLLVFVGLGVGAIAVTTWESLEGASAALHSGTEQRLAAIRQTRARQIERYFVDAGNHVLALSADESAVTALEQLRRIRPAYDFLRGLYITDARGLLIDPSGAGEYGAVHARFHPTFHRYAKAFGFYDIFLLGTDGRVLYTVQKESDFLGDLNGPELRDSGLSRAWRRALALPELESFVIEDYTAYAPSAGAPAAFLAAPVYRAGVKIGVLAIQLSIDEINRVMTGGRGWREEGLGATGQAYIVARDGTLRSDLRAELEAPGDFAKGLRQEHVPEQVVERVSRFRTGVLNLKPPAPHRPVLKSQTPVEIDGLNWNVVAEIDAAEALAPVAALRAKLIVRGLVLTVLLLLAAAVLARRVTRPVLALAGHARRLAERDFSARVPVESPDELGELAEAFNGMTEELQRTTVSRDTLDRTLNALTDAVFLVEVPRGAGPDAILNGRAVAANPAARSLLGADSALLRDMLAGPERAERLKRLASEGRLPATEAALRDAQGTERPILFAASWLAEESGRPPGIVCIAQDIADWKRTQAELERLTARLIEAQEEERARLARELHDDLTQRLAAVAIDAGRLRQTLDPALADRIQKQMASLSTDVHGLSRRLHPSVLDDLGLVAAMESECRSFFERGGPPVEFTQEGDFAGLPKDTQLGLYRIVQEALRNIAKHAGADEVRIHLTPASLRIEDNGRGFDLSSRPSGLGLSSIAERTRMLGGTLAIESQPGRGTSIHVQLHV